MHARESYGKKKKKKDKQEKERKQRHCVLTPNLSDLPFLKHDQLICRFYRTKIGY